MNIQVRHESLKKERKKESASGQKFSQDFPSLYALPRAANLPISSTLKLACFLRVHVVVPVQQLSSVSVLCSLRSLSSRELARVCDSFSVKTVVRVLGVFTQKRSVRRASLASKSQSEHVLRGAHCDTLDLEIMCQLL